MQKSIFHNRSLPKLILSILLFSLPIFILADNNSPKNEDRSTQIDAMFAAFDNEDTPGCAVMVIQNGKIIHATGYGMADLKRKVKMGPKISMRLGSVGKQFTAMTIMVLADRGKLSFDDRASKFIPELLSRYGSEITVRHLLTHTSGLPDYYNAMEQFPADRIPRNDDGAAVYAKWGKPRFEPGEKHEYSNPGYEMLALIVERVSGKSFADFMKSEIFNPLGMKNSLVLDHPETHFPNRGYGYRRKDAGFILNDDHRFNLMFGAGGIYSTLEDLFKWDQSLYTEKLVKKSTLEQAFSPARLNNGQSINYGFGWSIGSYKRHHRVSHGGSWVGFRAGIARYLEEKFTVVVLTNHDNIEPRRFIDSISDLYLEPKDGSSVSFLITLIASQKTVPRGPLSWEGKPIKRILCSDKAMV